MTMINWRGWRVMPMTDPTIMPFRKEYKENTDDDEGGGLA